MLNKRPPGLWSWFLLVALVSKSSAQVCDKPTGQVVYATNVTFSASSTKDTLSVNNGVFGCCTNFVIGGWCPASNRSTGEWYEVNFSFPINVTSVIIQQPYVNDSGSAVPTVNHFKILYESALDTYGVLRNYSANNTKEVFQANYTNGIYELVLDIPVLARRVRFQVVNFTNEPCFRIDVKGCPIDIAPPPIKAPSLTFDPSGIMRLMCTITDVPTFCIDYWVTWYRGLGDLTTNISMELLKSGTSSSYLNVYTDDFSSQQKHQCQIKACYQAFCKDNATFTASVESNIYVPGIQITNTEDLVLNEGDRKHVKIRSNAPPSLLCAASGQDIECNVTLLTEAVDDNPVNCQQSTITLPQLLFPNDATDGQNNASNCAVKLTSENWLMEQSIAVTPNSGSRLSGLQHSTITIKLYLDTFLHQKNNSLRVYTTFNGETNVCEALSISHIRTFNGSRLENYQTGEFVLYRHKVLPYEIRTFSKDCLDKNVTKGSTRCTCAVGVRINDDVVLLKGCVPQKEIVAKLFKGENSDTFFVRRYNGGMQFEIILPTGGHLIAIKTFLDSINVWFYPGLSDKNSTTGLCGSYGSNSISDNEINKVDQWRVKSSKSYYNGRCPDGTTSSILKLREYTQCHKMSESNLILDSFLTCDMLTNYNQDADVTEFLFDTQDHPGNCVVGDNLNNIFTYSNTSSTQANASYTNGWTEKTAREACERAVNSSAAFSHCSLDLLDNDDYSNCMADIRLTGFVDWTQTLVDLFIERCDAFYGESGPPNDFLNVMCPNNCSEHGTCQSGVCRCGASFLGADCSINASSAPTISRLENNLCNSLVDDCTSFNIFGNGFSISTGLKCLYQKIQVNSSGYTTVEETIQTGVTLFITSSQVQCTLPSQGNYLTSIRNIGGPSSNQVIFITYNPACFSCKETGLCSQKPNTCYISDDCYDHLELNVHNQSQFCNATSNSQQWTRRTGACSESSAKWSSASNMSLVFHNDIIIYNITEEKLCQTKCTENIDLPCRSYDYYSAKEECYLSKASSKLEPEYLLPMNGISHGHFYCSNDRCSGQEIQWKSAENKVTGNTLSSHNETWKVSTCRSLCLADTSCQGINFLEKRGICLLVGFNGTVEPKSAPDWINEQFQCLNESSSREKYTVTSVSVDTEFKGPGKDIIKCGFPIPSDKQLNSNVIWAKNGVWYNENAQDTSTVLPNVVSQSLLYNDSIQCAVSLCDSSACEDHRGPLKFSEIYKVEIKIDNLKDITINEGDVSQNINILATAPPYVLCRHLGNDSESCYINLEFLIAETKQDSFCPNGTVIPQAAVIIRKNGTEASSCKLLLTNTDWQSGYTVNVKGITDHIYDGDHSLILNLTEKFTYNGSTTVTCQNLVQIKVLDKDTQALCSSVNDPHITTFDGRLYHNFRQGEFVLYRHTSLPYEVRAFYRSCAGRASCNCAIAARCGDDVIIIDKCGPYQNNVKDFYPMMVKLFKKGILTPGFRLLRQYEGREYQIIFPTGTIVYVDRSAIKGYNYLNVWVKPSPQDIGNTLGLCGKYDQNITNDLSYPNGTIYQTTSDQPLNYVDSWRVNPSDTYYTATCDNGDVPDELPSYCYCDTAGVDTCGDGHDLVTCPFLERDQTDVTDELEDEALFPLKCLNLSFEITKYPLFEYSADYNPGLIDTSRPSDNGGTPFLQAQYLCSSVDTYEVIKNCKDIVGVRRELAVSSCAYDIYISGQFLWIQAAIQNIQTQCEIQIERNSSTWEGNPAVPSKNYTNLFCIANCGNAGVCQEGVCNCSSGFGGSDCFVDNTKPPIIFGFSNGGLCDIENENCNEVIVFNNNSVNVPSLSCQIQKMMTNENGTFAAPNEILIVRKATFRTVNEIKCPLTGSGTYEIKISNDGIIWSKADYVFVFDSLCSECFSENKTCIRKLSVCLIDDSCYEDGEYNHKSVREFCNSTESPSGWQTAEDSCQGLNVLWLKEKGNILGGTSEPGDLESCKDKCLNQDQCLSFDFNSSSLNCSFNVKHTELLTNGSSYNYKWICENRPCPKKNITWSSIPGFTIIGAAVGIMKITSSLVECRKLCLQETSFVCRSIQLLSEAKQCLLSPLTSETAMEQLVRWPGYVFQEWKCDSGAEIILPTANPIISIENVAGDHTYTPVCTFYISDNNTTLRAVVEFIINDQVLDRQTLLTNDDEIRYYAYMNQSKITNITYGTELSCGATLCLNDSCDDTLGGFRRSQKLSLIIKVTSAPSIFVTEGQPAKMITIESHFPPAFLCDTFNSTSDCSIIVKAQFDAEYSELLCPSTEIISQIVFGGGSSDSVSCGVEITSMNWRTVAQIGVVAKVDHVVDGNQTRSVQVIATIKTKNDQILWNQTLQKLEVTAIDQDSGAVCVSMSDVHVVTFDGRYINVYYEGEMILYSHTVLPYEVCAFYRRCSQKTQGSCTCAVAVKSEDDVFVFDRCGASANAGPKQPIDIKLYQVGNLSNTASIRCLGGGLKYEVSLPSGTVVEVDVKSEHLNVLIIPSAYDFNRTRGLCNVYYGNKDTALLKSDNTLYERLGNRVDEFSLSWRVKTSESIYSGYCGMPVPSQTQTTFCHCERSSNNTCGLNVELKPCFRESNLYNYWKGEDITTVLQARALKPMCGSSRVFFEYDSKINAGTATWPTKSNYNETFSTSYCTQIIKGDSEGAKCSQFLPEDFGYAVTACVKDIQLSDDLSWARSSFSTFISLCRLEYMTKLTLWVNNTGQLGPDLDSVNKLCFNQCSMHGTCSLGVCKCQKGFDLADCSLNLSVAPIISFLDNGGICDITKSKCDFIQMFGATFANSDFLICKLQEIQILEGTIQRKGNVTYIRAEYFSLNEITCHPPKAGSYEVQISNDNITFSATAVFTLHDPKCHKCSKTGNCSITAESCFIENGCYLYGEENPDNNSLVCDNYQAYDLWSVKKETTRGAAITTASSDSITSTSQSTPLTSIFESAFE